MIPTKGSKPTHTPLYLGTPAEAICAHHGEMERKHRPLIEKEKRIYAPRDGIALYACPECCIDLFALAGEPNVDPEWALRILWKRYVETDWKLISRLFVDLGSSHVESTAT